MKLQIEAKLTKLEAEAAPAWWRRRISVPIPVVIAALAAIVGLGVLLTRRATPDVYTGPSLPASATFVGVDAATRGAWKSSYGAAAYAVAGAGVRSAGFANIEAPKTNQSWKWADEIEDTRALQKPGGAKRVAAAWFAWTPFNIGVTLRDPKAHRLAVYLVDWDAATRIQNIDVLDGGTGQVLDTRKISDFSGGQYLVWTVTGHVVLRISPLSKTTAIVNGIFID